MSPTAPDGKICRDCKWCDGSNCHRYPPKMEAMIRCTCGAMITSVDAICETCLPGFGGNARPPLRMRAALVDDYREKVARIEEELLEWKEAATLAESQNASLTARLAKAEGERANEWFEIGTPDFDEKVKPFDGKEVLLFWDHIVVAGQFLDNSKTSKPWHGFVPASNRHWPKGQPTHWRPFPKFTQPLSPRR